MYTDFNQSDKSLSLSSEYFNNQFFQVYADKLPLIEIYFLVLLL